MWVLQQRAPPPRVALDVDANLIPSAKCTALPMYEEGTGYQPLGVWWAEQEVWVRSQFRGGKVPAQFGVLEIAQQSVASLRAGGDGVRAAQRFGGPSARGAELGSP